VGGAAASCIPTTGAFSGGNGGLDPNSRGGGGGAAGPGGAGGNGGAGTASSNSTGGGGGGGASATVAGYAGVVGTNSGASYTSGGNGGGNTGGGAAGTSASKNGGAGTAVTGGGGGGAQTSGTPGAGGTGIAIWTQTSNSATAGPGGGGGGTGDTGTGNGGAGGLYGGGSGGGATSSSTAGGQGIIVFTYIGQVGSGFEKPDDVFGTIDLDDQYVTDSWLVDKYVGGTLFGWGSNAGVGTNGSGPGQLGQGFSSVTLYYSSPLQVGSLTNWKSVGGDVNMFGIKTDGTLWGWGANLYGALGTGNNTTYYSSPVQVGALTNWKQITSGGYYTGYGVTSDGKLYSWGFSRFGSLGQNDTANSTYYNQPTQIGSLTNWNSVSAKNSGDGSIGLIVSLATKQDGTLWSWGWNALGGLGLGTTTAAYYSNPIQVGSLTNWKQVSTGFTEYAAIKTDGTLWMWGWNGLGQLGQNYIGGYYSSPLQVGSLTNWKQVSVGARYVMAIKTDGTLWSWGQNQVGQLGFNTSSSTVYYSSPTQVGSLTNWKQVSSGFNQRHVSAIKTDGTLWKWGDNTHGQFGINSSGNYYSSPIQVGSLTNWKQIFSGFAATFGTTFTDLN
jgi:alpha-tubulin suppressor-like RCC1 family protein